MTKDKRYRVIAKVHRSIPGKPDRCCKWKVNDLISFTRFLDKNYPDWQWFNVFKYAPGDRGQQLASFSKYNRPTSRSIQKI